MRIDNPAVRFEPSITMSYVIQIWEQPIPTSVEEADRITDQLNRERCTQNPKFLELAQRLMARFPGPGDDGDDDGDVWTDVELDGECDQPVYGLGVRTERLSRVLPFVLTTARGLGLVAYDPQAGEVQLPDGRTLGDGTGDSFEVEESMDLVQRRFPQAPPSGAFVSETIRAAFDPLMSAHGFKLSKKPVVNYQKKLKACTQSISLLVNDRWLETFGYVELAMTFNVKMSMPSSFPTSLNDYLLGLSWISFNLQKLNEIDPIGVNGKYFNEYNTTFIHSIYNKSDFLLRDIRKIKTYTESPILSWMRRMESLSDIDKLLNESELVAEDEGGPLVKEDTPITAAYLAANPRLREIAKDHVARRYPKGGPRFVQDLLAAVGIDPATLHSKEST